VLLDRVASNAARGTWTDERHVERGGARREDVVDPDVLTPIERERKHVRYEE
jgi:hypothetical protein